MSLSQVPPGLKVIKPYVMIGVEMYQKKPVVAYHCFSYAMRSGLKTNYKTDAEAKAYLFKLMDHVESMKNALCSNEDIVESVKNDMEGQMTVESAACEYFEWADGQDRAGNIDKRVMKAFYTSHLLFCVLQIFNEPVSERCLSLQKYAAWKSTYIKKCFMTGETPIPGPMQSEEDLQDDGSGSQQADFGGQSSVSVEDEPDQPSSSNYTQPSVPAGPSTPWQNPQQSFSTSQVTNVSPSVPQPAPRSQPTFQQPSEEPQSSSDPPAISYAAMKEAQKLCKFAGSALNYDDTPTAIGYLEKCLHILKTGQH